MRKTAFLYPGQGAQCIGMAQDFYRSSKRAKAVFEEGSELLGIDLAALCFEENDLLNRTDYTQPAMLTACVAMTRELEARGMKPDVTAGLSLGEYAAVCTAGGCSYADAIRVIWKRGTLMQQATGEGYGMAAVLALTGEQVRDVTNSIEGVSVANYNSPGQVVITGKKEALQEAEAALKAAGARRITPLNVSGAFHSPYMKPVGEQLKEALQQVDWQSPAIPYVANVNAQMITDRTMIPELFQAQVSASVCWEQSIRTMLEQGVNYFVEIGPGRTLTKLMSRIDRNEKAVSIQTMEEMEQVLEEWKTGETEEC